MADWDDEHEHYCDDYYRDDIGPYVTEFTDDELHLLDNLARADSYYDRANDFVLECMGKRDLSERQFGWLARIKSDLSERLRTGHRDP
jgi:hypothetical protein